MKKKLLMVFWVALLLSVQLMAQQVIITGKITSSTDGQPIPGATVKVKGKNVATQADNSGVYSISAERGQVLEFAYLGMVAKEAVVGNSTTINIALAEDKTQLGEVVVVGYGTQKKANLTGAVSTVNVAQTFESMPLTDPTKALQGVVPGLTITYGNGGLTAAPKVNIRGIGSINGTSNPLILVDNIETTDLSIINPNDIESVSVLKDAASTSIYGARAAFGVVLIKTKGGQKNQATKVQYTNNFSWNKATTLPDFADPVLELDAIIQGEARAGRNSPETFGMVLTTLRDGIANWQNNYKNKNTGSEMILGEDFDYIGGRVYFFKEWDPKKEMLNTFTNQQNHSLRVQGGSEKIGYYISSGYSDEGGIFKLNPDNVSKYNITAAINAEVAPWLNLDAKMLFRNFRYEYPNSYYSTGDWNTFWRWGSYFPFGTYNGNYWRHLPAYIGNAGTSDLVSNYNRIDLGATFKIADGLNVRADYSIGRDNGFRHVVGGGIQALDFWSGIPTGPTNIATAAQDFTAYQATRALNNTLNAYATYDKVFKDNHNFRAMVGVNYETKSSFLVRAERRSLLDASLPEIGLATGDQFASSGRGVGALAGYFARLNYNYKGKYLLEMNGRYDGSSVFSTRNRWGFFPSASAGYRLSEEKFMQPVKKIFNDIKFRASYGELGNQDVGGEYYSAAMSNATSTWINGNILANTIGAPRAVANSLTWEKVKDFNLGLDLRFLKDYMGLTVEWYNRRTEGMLQAVNTAATFGAAGPRINAGDLKTRGVEVALDFRYPVSKDLNLYGTLTFNDNKTEITKWDNPAMLITQNYKGKEVGEIWGFKTDRYFTSAADVTASPSQVFLQRGNFAFGEGDIKYKDLNGDGTINGGAMTLSDHGDLVRIGNINPRYQYGARFGGTFKGFDLDVFFQGVGKRSIWGLGQTVIPLYQSADIMYEHQLDFWTPSNTNAFYPRVYTGNNTSSIAGIGASGNNFYPQSKYLTDLSYLRLKNVTFGYTIKNDLLKKYKIGSFRIYVSGQNLAEFKGSNLPLDPEITDGDNSSLGRTYPFSRMYSFGVNLTF
jgi:TonB-linked SusC/RagA family outer membrane protein